MTSTRNEKQAASLEYHENAKFDGGPAPPVIEQVNYGYSGIDQGVISLILVMPQFQAAFPECDPKVASNYGFNTGFMTGMLVLGGFLGCLCFPYLADKLSRKIALTIAVVVFNLGAIIQTAAPNYGTLVAGRAIGGIGVGTLAMGAPLYISEIAPAEMRGSLLVLEELMIVIGAIISYWVTYGTKDMAGEASFRLPFGLQMVSATLLGAGIHLFPYSPRWLVMADRHQDSLKVLSKLRKLPAEDPKVQAEWHSIINEISFQRTVSSREHPGASGLKLELLLWGDVLSKKTLKRTIVACGICFFTQFSGINAFVYYAPILFTNLGQEYNASLILSGMINIGQLIGVIPAMIFIDKLGRRKLAVWGALGMGVSHTIMAGIYGTYGHSWPEHTAAGWACVAFVYVYVVIFGLSYGPLIWTMPAEVFDNVSRAKGVGLAVAVSWLANFIIGIVVPPMIESITYGTFIFFAAFCFLAAIFSFFLVPETANKTLEEIDALFD
ncbi:hypothetical protein FSARC_14542 [Fusarium sarcochroum]|uniref:Major facilitator superfamily (MFS) profile domain-containing protein n=1 Tax=Fusarium sarcochroum TaxID=1208366 RepID=A0A8H4SSH4_9HYPO|nr:hypothetical protein FSARC_14542 [Fusarium sarcochroum]